jgi:hypothetical protein
MTIEELDIEGYPQSHVMVEGEWIPVSKTEFLNIAEDIQGRDVMTFEYAGKTYESYVTMR